MVSFFFYPCCLFLGVAKVVGDGANGWNRFTTEIQMANGHLRRESLFTWISSLRFGRRVMILLSILLRLASNACRAWVIMTESV
jgi:hypothetical protein